MRHRLVEQIDSLRPIIYMVHHDDKEVDEIIASTIPSGGKIREYSPAYGAVKFDSKMPYMSSTPLNLSAFLDMVISESFNSNIFIILRDVHELLSHPRIYSRLKKLARQTMYTAGCYATVFIVSPDLTFPKELEHLITIHYVSPPSQKEIEKDILPNYAKNVGVEIEPSDIGELALNLRGLSKFQIEQTLNLAYCRGGTISKEDTEFIFEEKKQMILKSGLLEIVANGESVSDIGGLPELKKWIERKSRVFKNLDQALKAGVCTPKGVLISGLPGCGKSIMAKATATAFGVPLVRLDVGRLLGKYVGESEKKMRNAFRLTEAISPCVLWIDELEKAFANVDSGNSHEVTMRLLGLFLTWMQEKQSTVFCVATSNNIEGLPPELLRKGRFDELFAVNLPSAEERLDIIKIHLNKRNQYHREMPIHKLAKENTDGFSGAEIESAINEAVETMFIEGRCTLTIEDLMSSFSNVRTMSNSFKETIKSLKEFIKKHKIRDAAKA